MKKIIYVLLIGIAFFSIESCDHVENPFPPPVDLDTTIYPGNWSDYVANEWPDFSTIPNDDPERNVLIEDYTGHTCSNCPAAATVAHNLHLGNPDRVFVASIHADNAGLKTFQTVNIGLGYTIDFTNTNGTDLGYFFGTTLTGTEFNGNPAGTINRSKEENAYFYASSFWSTKTTSILNSDLYVNIKAKVNYYEENKGLFLHTEVELLPGAPAASNLGTVVYLIEDSLVGPQNVSSTYTPDYIHRDIMRGSIDGNIWGRNLTDGNLINGKYYLDYSFHVPDQLAPQGQLTTYNAENMHLLIYVYDKSTYEILQVIKKNIVS